GHAAEVITADRIRDYQLVRRRHGAEAATINRETSALSRMFQIAIRRGLLDRLPLFPTRLEENPPRDGFFEHDEFLKVRAHAPASYQPGFPFWPSLMADYAPRHQRTARLFRRVLLAFEVCPAAGLSRLELTGSDAI